MKSIPIFPKHEFTPAQRAAGVALLLWGVAISIDAAATGRRDLLLFGVGGGMLIVAVFLIVQWHRAKRFSLNWDGVECKLSVGERTFFEGSLETMHAVRRNSRGYCLYLNNGSRFYSLRSSDLPKDLEKLLEENAGHQPLRR